jgi:hypothetical protein
VTASGARLWSKEVDVQVTGKAEREGLPGLHAPGVQAADIDGDGATEVLFLTKGGALSVVAGASGFERASVRLPAPPPEAERWEHLVVANFRGRGDRDLLLQATNAAGYRMGRFLAAYALDELPAGRRGDIAAVGARRLPCPCPYRRANRRPRRR